jgi:hypothetical protein
MLLHDDFVVKINSALVAATHFLQAFLATVTSYYLHKTSSKCCYARPNSNDANDHIWSSNSLQSCVLYTVLDLPFSNQRDYIYTCI